MKVVLSLVQLVFLGSAASCQSAAVLPREIGVYLGWVGTFGGNRLHEGARLARQAGFQTVRVPLVAGFARDFNLGTKCKSVETLEQVVSEPAYADVLGDPSFRTVILTTWGDSKSYDACQARDPHSYQHPEKEYLDPTYYNSGNRANMQKEYAELTYGLYKAYSGTGKTFGIANWEGDNDLHCNNAWGFANLSEFRQACEKKRDPKMLVNAYREFLTLRQEGIDEGKKRAAKDGFKDVSVVSIIEFSSLRTLQTGHFANMLDDVIPFVPKSDYYSYSAWESIGSREGLSKDLSDLQARFHGRLMVGEFGFDRGLIPSAGQTAAESAKAMQKAGIAYAIWWQIFDQPPVVGLGDKGLYGLYDQNGHLTDTGKALLPSLKN